MYFKKITLAFALMLALAVPGPVDAAGGLMIMPIRVIFKDRDRTGNVTLINTNADPATFRISMQSQKQRGDGSYEISAQAFDPAHDLSTMLVYSPRQVTLEGSSKQRIRLSLRRPPELTDGEYRTHLVMTNLGKNAGASSRRPPEGKLAIELNMNVGYSLPVILRQGSYDTAVSMSDFQYKPATNQKGSVPQIHLTLNRTGKYSSFGKLTVHRGGEGGQIVGTANNVNVFPEVDRRTTFVNLTEPLSAGESVYIVYEGDGPDKGVTFDAQTVPVGG